MKPRIVPKSTLDIMYWIIMRPIKLISRNRAQKAGPVTLCINEIIAMVGSC